MAINRLIALLIVSVIGATAFGLFNNIPIIVSLGHIFTLPMIGIWYGFKRSWSSNPIDIAVYFTFLVGSFSDSVILIGGQVGEILQISLTLIMHMMLIIIFRQEGTRIYSESLKDLPKLLIPISIIFSFFGAVLVPILPNAIYFLSIIYSIQEMILVSHGLFRKVKGKSYWWVAIGVSLIIIKDVMYSYNFFIYQNKILYLYIIQYCLSAVVYFMITVGLAFNQTGSSTKVNKNIWISLKENIKILFTDYPITPIFQKLNIFLIKNCQIIRENFRYYWSVSYKLPKLFNK